VEGSAEITVLQMPKFKAEAAELIGMDGIEELAVYLINHPDAGDVIQGSGGIRKLRWASKGKGKRGGARIIYLYVVIAARIYLIRSDRRREEATAASGSSSEGSAIECLRKPAQRRQPSAPG
jgi:hypothetical protein